ncbi:MAG: hypothetical protein IKX70_02505 [Treponema sp.]|nr:hypothetical protein [Treponema sp.]MBR5032524.1 hypothetical protein [Treponema sp.]
MKRKLLCVLAAFFTINILGAVELVPTQQLLASYLEQDTDLKNLALELKKAKLNQQSTEIDKGFTIKLSTGDMTMTLGDNNSFSVKPGVNATIPGMNNLGLNVSSQLSVADGKTTFDSASATVSVDIISSNKANRDISLLKSERSVLEAERNLTAKATDKEKSFYKSLSNLMNSISSIVQKQNTIIDDFNSLEKIKLQGYASTSATYIKAQMKLESSERDLESAIHTLIRDYKLFYASCGYEIEIPEDTDFKELIPEDIPEVEAEDISEYKAENYTQIESNLWNQTINQMTRDANTKLTLSANGGYTYRNNNGNGSNTVSAGVSAGYEGLSLSANVNVPIASGSSSGAGGAGGMGAGSSGSSPTVTLGITYTPTTSKKNKISDQLTEISIEQEQMKIESAWSAYETAVLEKQLKLEDLEWDKETNQKNYEMYTAVEEQMLDYYKKGLISEKDYTSAVINTLQAKVKGLINRIDFIVYNDEVKAMFVEK